MNKLWWFIRNQIAKTISTSNKFIVGLLHAASALSLDPDQGARSLHAVTFIPRREAIGERERGGDRRRTPGSMLEEPARTKEEGDGHDP